MEYMPDFKLHRPDNIEDAVKLRAEEPDALFVAGGTDMIVNVRRGIEQPKHLIDITAIEELKSILRDGDGLHIGAGVSLKELQSNADVLRDYPAVGEAARAVAGPTHQEYGTVGGNLCLDTRCLFYNQSEWWRQSNDYCLKERGDTCHVAPGGKRCFAAFSGDMAPSMLVYGAEIDVAGPNGRRRMPLTDLYRNDGMAHLTLEAGDMLTAVHLPKALAGSPSRYEKARVRGSIDFPLAGAAVRLEMDGKTVKDFVVALTAVNPYPQIAKGTDAYVGRELTDEALDEIRELVRKQAKPMRTTTVAPWYRRRVVGALARRRTEEFAG
ncbi:MAG: 4-hydroxybenzoyl-CoA reductase subunit beta [Rhodospirillales bacterium]|nr:4-hydroxybenzoyl-CoA reductase subunit beta [Rhodospirillales bacterium]